MMYAWTGGWHMGWMWLGWIGFVVVVAAAVWVLGRLAGGADRPRESAREVLRLRYAKGEIDRETYERMLKEMGG